jgi:alpha/beta superfamily hydrolase
VAPAAASAPPVPADGTYVYTFARNDDDQGTTTLVVRRRDPRSYATEEAGTAGAASAHIVAVFSSEDFRLEQYTVSVRAPFVRAPGGHVDPNGTVTFHAAPRSSVFDAPFATSVFFVPAARRGNSSPMLSPIGVAFDEGSSDAARARIVSVPPHFSTTPKTDVALELPGVATIWFGPRDDVVHEVHFDRLNIDARLTSYVHAFRPAAFRATAQASPAPKLATTRVAFDGDDGVKRSAELALPGNGDAKAPLVVFVPQGDAALGSGGDGPDSMFADVAPALAQRGFAVLRYGARDEPWERAIADVRAAVAYARLRPDVDPDRVYVLGYASGADVAIAAASNGTSVAGVIALAPTVLTESECARRARSAANTAFARSSLSHDPRAIAARSSVPLFVVHPGVARCGETHDETLAFDDALQSHDPRATIVAASDLSARFGGIYAADAPLETDAFFPYHFDPSTSSAIADWAREPHATATSVGAPATPAARPHAPPPPPIPAAASPSETPAESRSPAP